MGATILWCCMAGIIYPSWAGRAAELRLGVYVVYVNIILKDEATQQVHVSQQTLNKKLASVDSL